MANINWENLPSTNTPINATNLNKVDEGLVNVGTSVDSSYKTNILVGKNLFNKSLITDSYYIDSSGNEVSASGWFITNYISIKPNTTYTSSGFTDGSGNTPARCYYTIDKTFISGTAHNSASPFIETTPANAYYMRESCRKSGIDTLQIEKGSSATSYQAYIVPSIYANEIEVYKKNNLEIYSTTEQRIGTWIDGKPLYRKVLTSSMPTATSSTTPVSVNIDVTNLNIDFCMIEGHIVSSSSSNLAVIPLPYTNENGKIVRIQKYSNYISIYSNSVNLNNRYIYIILKYTKTTD